MGIRLYANHTAEIFYLPAADASPFREPARRRSVGNEPGLGGCSCIWADPDVGRLCASESNQADMPGERINRGF